MSVEDIWEASLGEVTAEVSLGQAMAEASLEEVPPEATMFMSVEDTWEPMADTK
jgi:hypothetical protein